MALEKPLLTNIEMADSSSAPPAYSEEVVMNMQRNYPLNNSRNHEQNSNQPEFVVSELGAVGNLQPHGNVNTPNIKIIMPGPAVIPVGPNAMRMRCYHCGADIKTSTVKSSKAISHLACYLLGLGLCFLCCWVPYCMDSCKKVDHMCPSCGEYLGTYDH